MTSTERLRALLDKFGVEHYDHENGEPLRDLSEAGTDPATSWRMDGANVCAVPNKHGTFDLWIDNCTPEQAIAATVGPTLDQDLQQALDFMRIWITDDAHLGESDISYELEKAEGLRNLEAIEQAIAATVGTEPWEPSKEWKAWHESLRHDNPTNVREVVESILFDAIEFGGDMGPNGNVCSGVDEGDVLTDGCINGWVKSIEAIAATMGVGTCHVKAVTKLGDSFGFQLSCGHSMVNPFDDRPDYCPWCGRKVVER